MLKHLFLFVWKRILICPRTTIFLVALALFGVLGLCAFIFQSFIAIFVGLPLFEILMVVSRLSAETYIVEKMKEPKAASL